MTRGILVDRCYVLHRHAWKETSFIVRVLTEARGRYSLVARGVRGRQKRVPLMPGVLCDLTWTEGRDLGRVVDICPVEPVPRLRGDAWWALQYLNELLLHALPEAEASDDIFKLYANTLRALEAAETQVAARLRVFEYGLLQALGLGFDARCDAEGIPLDAHQAYQLIPEKGLVAAKSPGSCLGEDWLQLADATPGSEAAMRLRTPLQAQLSLQVDFGRLRSRALWLEARKLRRPQTVPD